MVLPSLYHDTAIVSFVEIVIKEQSHIITDNEMLIYTVCVWIAEITLWLQDILVYCVIQESSVLPLMYHP